MTQAISPLLGTAAAPIVVDCGGKQFPARLITQGVKTEWESGLRSRAMAAVLPLRALDRDAFAEASNKVAEQSAQGAYGFQGEISLKALATPGGFLAFVCLVFGVDEEDATVLLTEATDATLDALDQVLIRSFPKRADAIRAVIAERKEKETPAPNP